MLSKYIYSQAYVEQYSGVTTGLTSVSLFQTNNNSAWICGYSGVVLKTTNFGVNWINKSGNGIPGNVDLINIFCVDTAIALTAGFSSTGTFVYRTSNGGANWQQVFSQPNGFIDGIWMKTPSIGFMYGDPVGSRWSLWKTSNGGVNWDSSGMYVIPQSGTEAGNNNALFVRNNKIWFGTNNYKIYYSSNFGSNWIAGTAAESNTTSIWFYYADSSYGYYGGSNSYKTTNGGSTWTLMTCPGSANFAGFVSGEALSPNNPYPPSMSWTVRNDNKIYQNYNMSNWAVGYTAPAGNYWHIGTNFNILYQYTWAVRSNGGITRVVTLYGGVKKISSTIPDNFSLSQNYPNPFNPFTKIKFSIPPSKGARGMIRLVIYDVLGKEIAVLVNEQLKPGTYEVEWDGSNYTSGVYFYKLIVSDPSASSRLTDGQAGQGHTETRKMVLVK